MKSLTGSSELALVLLCGAGTLHAQHAQAEDGVCQPGWSSTFGPRPGVSGAVRALAVFDDGEGDALYVGGGLTQVGGAPSSRIARWNGARWSQLPGKPNRDVQALAVFDDGAGPALFVGGQFTTILGATPASFVARWNGASWSALGSGTSGPVYCLARHDDGRGESLFVGGRFQLAGGVVVNHVARWDGASWSALAGGVGVEVDAAAVFDDGGGPALDGGG